MQFLLTAVNARYIHSNPAIYSLRAYAGERLRSHIALAEYTINQRMEDILGDLYRRKPDAIGFSCYIWNWNLIQELLAELPKVLPEADLWLGGPEVSFGTEELLEDFPMVKGVMAGEGEETFRELLERYVEPGQEKAGKDCRNFSGIPGLILRGQKSAARELLNLDRLPFFYGNLHEDFPREFENRIIYYETGRGCPFRCSYCLSSVDKKVRLKTPGIVKRELQFFLDRRVPQVKLTDRTFNCNHHHALEIWTYIREHDNGITNFHFEIAGELLTEEEIDLLQSMRPGLVQLEIGVQSVNPQTLKEINRPGDISHLRKVVGLLRSGGNIHIHLDLIAGLPFEDYESFRRSFNEVYSMNPHQLQLGFLKVLKGTLIRERAKAYGMAYREKPPYEVLCTKWISYGELQKLKRIEEMVELYYNSGQFRYTLPVLEREFAGPFEMFEALADNYEEKGYSLCAPARSLRYQILLEAAVRADPDREKLYRELLTFDFYLRENAKSRPEFCADLSFFREKIWEFYRKEEEKPDLLRDYSQYHARQTMKMTHMEVFSYPVWESRERTISGPGEEPIMLLFDYRRRSPVTGDAFVCPAK